MKTERRLSVKLYSSTHDQILHYITTYYIYPYNRYAEDNNINNNTSFIIIISRDGRDGRLMSLQYIRSFALLRINIRYAFDQQPHLPDILLALYIYNSASLPLLISSCLFHIHGSIISHETRIVNEKNKKRTQEQYFISRLFPCPDTVFLLIMKTRCAMTSRWISLCRGVLVSSSLNIFFLFRHFERKKTKQECEICSIKQQREKEGLILNERKKRQNFQYKNEDIPHSTEISTLYSLLLAHYLPFFIRHLVFLFWLLCSPQIHFCLFYVYFSFFSIHKNKRKKIFFPKRTRKTFLS